MSSSVQIKRRILVAFSTSTFDPFQPHLMHSISGIFSSMQQPPVTYMAGSGSSEGIPHKIMRMLTSDRHPGQLPELIPKIYLRPLTNFPIARTSTEFAAYTTKTVEVHDFKGLLGNSVEAHRHICFCLPRLYSNRT